MPDPRPERKIIMARRVARRWVARVAEPEYRFQVLAGPFDFRNLPNLLRAFRDGKVAVEGIKAIPDLGVKEEAESVSVWSKDREALLALNKWFEGRGFETTGVW